jgi:predicted SnoaL-like aldol condensation-catalyzing enzyme
MERAPMHSQNTLTNKESAVKFLQLVVAGNIDAAYRKFVDMEGKHHNFYFPAGFPALKKAMIDNQDDFPDKQLLIKHVLGEGDFVAVHSQLIMKEGGESMAVVHLFRFSGHKITEMWDIGHPVPVDLPNADGAF